ncbi:hypothetical protein BDY21DRAFT_353104 [Lineolata rhizophorae]|uniref:Uncharacterized protein n=1 Tax=Lineolata rhizophorae TaxID=578093 RepID=A0A6A6NRS4_9PEZI|nr:hypothetical protein BDY21DRAFT_353104 [Lineolata rhizophorae]
MLELQPSSSRKRPRSELPQLSQTSQPISKKQRLSHGESPPPPAFWDNLSKVWLTKRALRELDRRNIEAAPSRPPCSPHRPARRPKRNCQTAQYPGDYLSCCEPRILKDIKLFARHGGPDLSDLRNYPEPPHSPNHTMSSSQSSRQRDSATTSSTRPTTNTTRTKSTGVYDRDFQQHLIDNAVYPHEYEYPDGSVPAEPNNWEDLKQTLAQPRPSLSPSRFSDREFRNLKRADAHAAKEKQVSESVIPIIEGEIGDAKCRSGGIPFTNLDPLTDSTLKPGNPDIYYGARPEQLSRKVRDERGGYIIPSTQKELPIAPNCFLAVKGPDGSLAVARRQACYDGALGARGVHSLQSYQQDEPFYDNNAYTISSIYHGGRLQMYTSHVAPPRSSGGRPEYHMTQLRSFDITDTPETCREGLRAYRNGRDWCKDKLGEAIRQANKRANLEAEAPTGDAGASPALGFTTTVSHTEVNTMSHETGTSLNESSNVLGAFEESSSSIEDPTDYTLPAKRSGKRSSHQQSQRKRHNAGESSGTRHSHESTGTSISEGPSTSNTTVEQIVRWSWTSGHFQCHKGQDLVKKQNDTPADVWIYCDEGWPGQEGKKWRLWISAAREILYS